MGQISHHRSVLFELLIHSNGGFPAPYLETISIPELRDWHERLVEHVNDTARKR